MDLLIKFHADFNVRDAVKEYLIEHLKEQAVKKSFNGDSTQGIKEAKECIDNAFRKLDNMFTEKKERKQNNSR